METVFLFGKPQATAHRARGPRHPINKKHLPQGRTAAQRTTTGLWSDSTGTRQPGHRGGAVPREPWGTVPRVTCTGSTAFGGRRN